MNFGDVLSRAWQIIWKYKVLWVFGVLASLASGGGNGGGSNSGFRFNENDFSYPSNGFERFFENIPAWVPVLAALFAIVLVIALILLGTLGRAGLLRGAWLADSENGAEMALGGSDLTFRQLWGEAQVYFGRVLLLTILVFLLGVLIFVIIAVPTVLTTVLTFGLGLLCLIPLLCLLIPVFMLLGVLVDLSLIAIVGEDRDVTGGLQRGWEVFRANLAEVIVLAIVLGIINAVIGFFIGLPMLMIALPFMTLFFNQSQGMIISSIVVAVVLFLIYLPILLGLRGILQSYVDTAWTVAFRRMTGRGPGTGTGSAVVEIQQPMDPVL